MSEPRFPWRVGETLGDGWRVQHIERHPEFVVVRAKRGQEVTGFEVTYHEGPAHPWATARYRVQPIQGEEPVVELLADVLAALETFDGEGYGEPFVKNMKVAESEKPEA